MNALQASKREHKEPTYRERLAALAESGVRTSRIALEAGVRPADVKAAVGGGAIAPEVEARLVGWIEDLDGAAAAAAPPWIETPSARQIMGALELARTTPTIAVVYGGAGVSKTTAATRYAREHSDYLRDRPVIFVSASRFRRSPTAVLQMIAEAADEHGHAYRTDGLVNALLNRLAAGSLIVVDEAQHLDADALDGLRVFLDEGEIGLCYLGNEEVYARICGKGRRAAFAQLHSRVGMRLHLPRPTEEDVDAILAGWRIRGREEVELAHAIASQPGGIRTLCQVLRQADVVAREMKRPLDRELMLASAELLGIEE